MSSTVLPAGTDEHFCIASTVLTLNRNYWMDQANNPSEQTDQAANAVVKSPCYGYIDLLLLFHQAYLLHVVWLSDAVPLFCIFAGNPKAHKKLKLQE